MENENSAKQIASKNASDNSGTRGFSGILKRRGTKPLIIVAMLLLFMIPLSLIKSIIYDRKTYQEEAVESILEPLGGNPEISGLLVMLPYTEHFSETDAKGIERKYSRTKYIFVRPENFSLDSKILPYTLTRGIYSVPVFTSDVTIEAKFEPVKYQQFTSLRETLDTKNAVLILGLSKTKILAELPKIKVAGLELSDSLTEYNSVSPFEESVYYTLPEKFIFEGFSLKSEFKIQGGEKLIFQPIGTNCDFSVRSDWKNPGFSGGWLPTEREITKDGFFAKWNVAGLTTVFPKMWESENGSKISGGEKIVTTLVTPVDTYQKTIRSIKYALLFLLVPFLAIFICEIFAGANIHPIQYALIGVADVMFYLLLLSISEHLDFNLSYYISALAVCASTLFYASAIFKKIHWGTMLSGIQFVSYVFLFGTLQADDYALLIGSVGLFLVIVALMFITRKIDWYKAE